MEEKLLALIKKYEDTIKFCEDQIDLFSGQPYMLNSFYKTIERSEQFLAELNDLLDTPL